MTESRKRAYTAKELREVAEDLEIVRGALIGTAGGMEYTGTESIEIGGRGPENGVAELNTFTQNIMAALKGRKSTP